ncbi:glutathione S-transferase family protein, partial [Vibrio sp. 2017_1457_15]|nr:glutathione S-transferase family protein [Vibrio sp. 2017_1457_15]MDQ2110171.1 glutathione S-transferase family protein [Vibrio sp. 2017_1457_15]MDQ2162859.1 glutathione S-transferase family protein [Vibrio sp. 2017_1457_13]MDQ2162993.1 glutathione S-transferase family protein [Vibrio sp. 2017_1457_13]
LSHYPNIQSWCERIKGQKSYVGMI